MSVLPTNSTNHIDSNGDPLLPWLRSISEALSRMSSDPNDDGNVLEQLVSDCIRAFKNDPKYQNDPRFLKVWFIYMDFSEDFDSVLREIEESKICLTSSSLYETCALILEVKWRLVDASRFYKMGMSRDAEPIERLKEAHHLFLNRMSRIVKTCSIESHKVGDTDSERVEKGYVYPWLDSTVRDLLQKINPQMQKFDGYHSSKRKYPQKMPLPRVNNPVKKKIVLEIGGMKYQVKGCAGSGAFAQVYKACVDSDPSEVVALKIQTPAFPWEFYMYRLLDMRISEKERPNFGRAQRLHLYSDYSILVCDYSSHGTLQDAINSYAVLGGCMEEELCAYYTIELLRMLETLHGAGIIHGDFKPDNLLTRYARDDLTVEEEDFRERKGPWHDQGLYLVDWGRGIDLGLFPDGTEFVGDCRTSGFRCIEMQQDKSWKFQVDTYGLCVVVHMMLHSNYMKIEKKTALDGSLVYLPVLQFKRYWNVKLWESLFKSLLNANPKDDHKKILADLRVSFQDYMCTSPSRISKLKQLLLKQRSSLCSS